MSVAWTSMLAVTEPTGYSGAPGVLVGRHVDELVREDGRWRFARRVGHIDIGALR